MHQVSYFDQIKYGAAFVRLEIFDLKEVFAQKLHLAVKQRTRVTYSSLRRENQNSQIVYYQVEDKYENKLSNEKQPRFMEKPVGVPLENRCTLRNCIMQNI